MISFFRKFREKLVAGGKIRNYLLYAFGEILLIVIGILIAVQINAWNTGRINDKQETIILNDLKQEYLGKMEELSQKNQLRSVMIGAGSQLLDMIHEGEFTVSRDSLDKLVGSTFISPTFDASNSVTEELLNSGKLYIIKNRELRKLITDWKSQLEKMEEEETNLVSNLVHNYIPYMVRKYPYNTMASFLFEESEEVWSQITKNTGAESFHLHKSNKPVDLDDLLADYEFESYISIIVVSCIAANLQALDLQAFIESVLALIDGELHE